MTVTRDEWNIYNDENLMIYVKFRARLCILEAFKTFAIIYNAVLLVNLSAVLSLYERVDVSFQ